MIFWDLTSCSLVDMFKHSGRICCLYLQGTLSCSDCMWVWDLMVPMHLGLSYPALTVEAADCSETSVVPVAQYSHLHCHYSETPSNTRNISLLKRVFSGKKKRKYIALHVMFTLLLTRLLFLIGKLCFQAFRRMKN